MEKVSLSSSNFLSHHPHYLLDNSSQEHSLEHESSFQSDHPNLTRQETISVEEYFSDENPDFMYIRTRAVRRIPSKQKEKRHSSAFLSLDGDSKPELLRLHSYDGDRADNKVFDDSDHEHDAKRENFE